MLDGGPHLRLDTVLTVLFYSSVVRQEHSYCFFSASAALCSVEDPWRDTDEVADMSFWLSPALIRTGDTLRGNTGPRFFSCLHQFCVKDYGFICLGCLVRRQSLTEGVLQNVICMLIPSQGVWRNGPFSMTATGPTLDTVSDLGAAASQLLLALQTGPRLALTGRVCGERLGPDAALTPVPSSMLFTFRCWQLLKKESRKKEEYGFQQSQTGGRN